MEKGGAGKEHVIFFFIFLYKQHIIYIYNIILYTICLYCI